MMTRHRINTYSGLLISGTLALLGVLLYVFTLFSITEGEGRIQVLTAQLVSEIERHESEQAIQKVVHTVSEQRSLLDSYFVASDDTARFLEVLEGYGKSTHTIFTLVDAKFEKEQKTVLVSFKAQGTFANIYQLVSLIENAPYMLVIEKAAFSTDEKIASRESGSSSGTIQQVKSTAERLPIWKGDFTVRLISFIPKK